MKKYNKLIGNYGEDITCRYLSNLNYHILDRNFRNKNGEIDIISMYKDILIFTEVKSRYNTEHGYAMESVTYSKQKLIKSIAKYYVHINNLYFFNIRFDVSEVYFNYTNDNYKINYLENAFF